MPRKFIYILENDRYYYDPLQILIDSKEDLNNWSCSFEILRTFCTLIINFYNIKFEKSILVFYGCNEGGRNHVKYYYPHCGTEDHKIYFIYKEKKDMTEFAKQLYEKYHELIRGLTVSKI